MRDGQWVTSILSESVDEWKMKRLELASRNVHQCEMAQIAFTAESFYKE